MTNQAPEAKAVPEIKFVHLRRREKDGTPSNRGGATVAYIEVAPNRFISEMALCNEKDNFNRKIGRTIASGRLERLLAANSEKDFVKGVLDDWYRSAASKV